MTLVGGTLVAGLDIGGTKTLAVITNEKGELLTQTRLATIVGDAVGVIGTLTGALREVAETVEIQPSDLAGVGVAVPGVVDVASGVVRHAVNLGIGEAPVDLAGPLGRLVDGPVTVGNDTDLAALGAALHFAADDLAYLSLGTGVSAGFVLDGVVRTGWRGVAGEIGHLPVDPHGEMCECGQRGCLETMISGAAIARRNGVSSAIELVTAAASGNASATAFLDELAGHMATAVALLAQTVDPKLVVIGGGVSEAGEPLVEAVRTALKRRAASSPLLAAFDLADRVVMLPSGTPAGALGAAWAALPQEVENA